MYYDISYHLNKIWYFKLIKINLASIYSLTQLLRAKNAQNTLKLSSVKHSSK